MDLDMKSKLQIQRCFRPLPVDADFLTATIALPSRSVRASSGASQLVWSPSACVVDIGAVRVPFATDYPALSAPGYRPSTIGPVPDPASLSGLLSLPDLRSGASRIPLSEQLSNTTTCLKEKTTHQVASSPVHRLDSNSNDVAVNFPALAPSSGPSITSGQKQPAATASLGPASDVYKHGGKDIINSEEGRARTKAKSFANTVADGSRARDPEAKCYVNGEPIIIFTDEQINAGILALENDIKADDDDVISNACWCLSYMSDKPRLVADIFMIKSS